MNRTVVTLGLSVGVLFGGPCAFAQVCEIAKLTAPDGVEGDALGYRFAFDGDRLLAGAQYRDTGGQDASGAAYLFKRGVNGWVFDAMFEPPEPLFEDQFGTGVALHDSSVLIGAPYHDEAGDNSGAVYVFTQDDNGDWNPTPTTLIAPDAQPGLYFGGNLDAGGDIVVIVGDRVEDGVAGAAYVYRWNGSEWVFEAKLEGGEGAERFGADVATDGCRIVVSATKADTNGTDSGCAFVFDYEPGAGWVRYPQPLVAADTDAGDEFGDGVGIDGNRLIVGAHYAEDDQGQEAGAAYVFRFNAGKWEQEQKIDGPGVTNVGSVDIDGDYAIATFGAPDVTHVYRRKDGEWSHLSEVMSSKDGSLGYDCAISGSQIATSSIEAPGDDGEAQGAVYVFDLFGDCECRPDFDPNGVLDFFDYLGFVNAFNAGCP